MPIYKTNLSHQLIKKIVKENYNIEILKISKIVTGSANLYKLFSKEKCYVLKEYQEKFDEKSIIMEYRIFKHLQKKKINVPKYIKCNNGKVCMKVNNNYISLQEFIDGNILDFYKGTTEQIMECSKMYAKIVLALEDFKYSLPKYNMDILNREQIKIIVEKYNDLIEKTDDKKIISELQDKLSMLNDIMKINLDDIDKVTIINSHGDYNVSQFIYDKNNQIKVILDYITAKKMPIVEELIRSYMYIDPYCEDGEININNFINYIKVFNSYYKLNKYDLKYMMYIYYIELVKSVFGYNEYINDNTKIDYINYGRRIYKQCLFLRNNLEKLTAILLKEICKENNYKVNVYHLVDHNGFGTIHKLIMPLCKNFDNHKMFTPYKGEYYLDNQMVQEVNHDINSRIIIHSTGSKDSIYLNNYKKMFPNKKIYVFMHTSVEYQKLKGRLDFVEHLSYICSQDKITVLVPSKEVAEQYLEYGINAKPIQLGIDNIEQNELYRKYIPELKKYYGKILTTCSSDNDIYKYVKGIDIFEKIIKKHQLEKECLIAGSDNSIGTSLECRKFNEDEFLNILYHCKAYIQFSRYETYNVTAIQAKRLKVPVLLMNAEGTRSCMNELVFNSESDLEKELLKIIDDSYNEKIIEDNYLDSKERENLLVFKNMIEGVE